MNVPAPKFMIEGTWRGRVLAAEWHNAAGGSLDVIEPATGATLTRVGNATGDRCAPRRRRGARRPARMGGDALRKARRHPAQGRSRLEDNQEELIPWIARETGGIPPRPDSKSIW